MASGAEQEIRRRISQRGPITFREYMELALYWPVEGYYPSGSAGADYYTAPSAHPAFGALVCLQLYQMWQTMERPSPFWVVEPGAGNGLLGADISTFSKHLPVEFGRSLRYLCLERHHAPTLMRQQPVQTGRLVALGLPFRGLVGVVLSNELLDAFPVHRIRMQRDRLLEVYVALEGERLIETDGPLSNPQIRERLTRVCASLENGWEAEVNLEIDSWMADVAQALERGYVLTIDYGHTAAELYSSRRPRGTLTTFRQHVQTDDPLSHIGYQDITAQVDFTALELAGTDNSLWSLGCTSQRQFLMNLGLQRWLSRLPGQGMRQAEADANRMGMQQLVRPGGMGDFQVMVQAKGVAPTSLWGLQPHGELDSLLETLPEPRLTGRHMPLLEASHPHSAQSFEHLWPFNLEPPA